MLVHTNESPLSFFLGDVFHSREYDNRSSFLAISSLKVHTVLQEMFLLDLKAP